MFKKKALIVLLVMLCIWLFIAVPAFAGLSVTTTEMQRVGRQSVRTGTLSFDSSYPTGGESFPAASTTLSTIRFVELNDCGGYICEYNYTSSTIRVYQASEHTHAVTLDTGASATTTATTSPSVITSVFMGGISAALAPTPTVYIAPSSASTTGSLGDYFYYIVPTAGSITGMYAYASTSPGHTATTTATLRKNATDTSLVLALGYTNNSAATTSPTAISVAAGDRLSVKVVTTGNNVTEQYSVSLIYSITSATADLASATHTHGPGTLADAASATSSPSVDYSGAEVKNGTDLSTLTDITL